MKYIFIVNPTSGAGRAKIVAENIEKICKRKNLDYVMHYTRFPHEATDFARMYKQSKNIIYAVGGDGTLNEVVNGIVGTKNMLGLIPSGSGNDFYRIIKNKTEEIFKIDIGKLNDRYFINVAGIGIDAEVGYNAEYMKKKKIPSSQIYNASIFYTFLKYKFKNIEYKMNGVKKSGTYTLITICNSKYYGGGYLIGPDALIDDGMFDIYFADKISKARIPFLIGKLKKGTHETDPAIHKLMGKEITIKSDIDIICGVDGEIIVGNKFKVKLLKKEITFYNDSELVSKFLDCK